MHKILTYHGRAIFVVILLALAFLLRPPIPRISEADAAIPLRPGPHLFLDDYLVESRQGLSREVNRPRRERPNPIITAERDKIFQPFTTVLRDGETGKFRIWYRVPEDNPKSTNSQLASMESSDGISWDRSSLYTIPLAPDGKVLNSGSGVIDEGSAFVPRDQRYKYGFRTSSSGKGIFRTAVSGDGLAWTLVKDSTPLQLPYVDIVSLAHDPIRNRYLAFLTLTRETFIPLKKVYQSESTDLVNWSTPRVILEQDEHDPPDQKTEFYGIDAIVARGDLLVGLVKLLHNDATATGAPQQAIDENSEQGVGAGMGHTQLAWSRDGLTWIRERTNFFEADPAVGTWDHAMAWGSSQVIAGNDLYMYYSGYKWGHKYHRDTERQLGLVRFPRDRYIALKGEASAGRLRTKPLVINVTGITVNAAASQGEIRVQVLDATGRPLPGFRFEDCKPIQADAVASPVQWGRSVSEIRGQTVKLEFSVKNARLYAFEGRL